MLKIFTIKFEDKLESFNDAVLHDFLADKAIIKWESHFFERKNDCYWTVMVEYSLLSPSANTTFTKTTSQKEENYKELLTENDWPLFNVLREWRGKTCKEEGVPPYIIFTNMQLAKIAVTRPNSLNALQEIEGIGNSKREKYGRAILQLIQENGFPAVPGGGAAENG
jgi:superfamily II DNA helicase RecQ